MTLDLWKGMAQIWPQVGPPLRPTSEDVAIFENSVLRWAREHEKSPRVLMLGVTPELFGLRWPSGTELHAIDGSLSMIETVWPGSRNSVTLGDWTEMPFETNSFDIVVCDGGFGLLPYPNTQNLLLREVHRVLASDGVFAVRLYTPRGRTGTTEEVFQDLKAGLIASVEDLKLRLWGSVHGSAEEGVRVHDVLVEILEAVGSIQHLIEAQGWDPDYVEKLSLYRDSPTTYHLTDAAEFLRMTCIGLGGFELIDVVKPGYALGACCPIFSLRRI